MSLFCFDGKEKLKKMFIYSFDQSWCILMKFLLWNLGFYSLFKHNESQIRRTKVFFWEQLRPPTHDCNVRHGYQLVFDKPIRWHVSQFFIRLPFHENWAWIQNLPKNLFKLNEQPLRWIQHNKVKYLGIACTKLWRHKISRLLYI